MKLEDINHIVFEATSHCNSKCPHCPRFTEDGFLHPDLPLEHLHLEQLSGLDVSRLTNLQSVLFEGDKGDPVMSPELTKIIDMFPQSVNILISTNGGIRSTDWWENLATRPNVGVLFSIDGLDDTNHLYRVNVDWNKVLENASAYINAGGSAVWRCLIFKHNQHQIDEIRNKALDMGFCGVIFRNPGIERFQGLESWPVKVNGVHLHDMSPGNISENELFNLSKDFHGMKRFYNRVKYSTDSMCPWARAGSIYINFQGHVLPCCMMHFETLNNYPEQKYFKQIVGSLDNISLSHKSLNQILDLYDNHLETSLRDPMTRLPVCKKTCYNSI